MRNPSQQLDLNKIKYLLIKESMFLIITIITSRDKKKINSKYVEQKIKFPRNIIRIINLDITKIIYP